jgi:acetolactate synthase I/II/III large subunit
MNATWDIVAAILARAGCRAVFGLPSDEYGLVDAAAREPGLDVLATRDQRVAACAAAGHAQISGVPAVLAVNSGPSFANAITALLEAASVCAPIVVVTTRIPARQLGRGGFQEVDQMALAAAFAKWRVRVESPERLEWALRHAVRQAVNGRPGVTVVEIADEVVQAGPGLPGDGDGRPFVAGLANSPVQRLRSVPTDDDVERAGRLLARARRPLIVAGGGARSSDAGPALSLLAESCGAMILTTASGRGTVPEDHPLSCGLVGLYLTPPFDTLADAADVVVVVGSRLEETARMRWHGLDRAEIIHIDCDPGAFGTWVEPAVALVGDAALTARHLSLAVQRAARNALPNTAGAREAWADRIEDARRRAAGLRTEDWSLSPVRTVFAALREVFPDAVVTQENGLHDLWGYHRPVFEVGSGTTVVTPGEQTMMGFGTTAAVGAAMAAPDRPVIAVSGDGALAMSEAALVTAAEHGIGLTVVMLDNKGLGWPRLMRREAGDDHAVTRFSASTTPAVVRSLSGLVAEPADRGELLSALREARRRGGEGRLTLIRVPADDEDVPAGVVSLLAGEAGEHDGHKVAGDEVGPRVLA